MDRPEQGDSRLADDEAVGEATALRPGDDVDDWLIRLQVYTPIDEDRLRELEYWRGKSDAEHAAVMRSLFSVLPMFPTRYRAKPPLVRRFPRRAASDAASSR
jgi:hypothetical protein